MKQYILNENQVCMQPEVDFQIGEARTKAYFAITVAERDGKWTTGYEYEYSHQGGGAKPAFDTKYRRFFDTRKEAVLTQIEDCLTWWHLEKSVRTALKDYRNSLKFEQLQLF